MLEHVQIRNQSDFDAFCDVVDRFHDGLIREAAIVARGYIDVDLGMWNDTEPFDMKLIIQLQSQDVPAVELFLKGVTECRLAPSATTLDPEADFGQNELRLFLEGRHRQEQSMIAAQTMTYRVLTKDHLGQGLVLVSPLAGDSDR